MSGGARLSFSCLSDIPFYLLECASLQCFMEIFHLLSFTKEGCYGPYLEASGPQEAYVFSNAELAKAYGCGKYNENDHDIIADAYIESKETFNYRDYPSMTKNQARQYHFKKIFRNRRKSHYKKEGKKVYFDDYKALSALDDEWSSDELKSRVSPDQYEYSFNPERILNKLLVQEVKSVVNNLLSDHKKKTRQMLLMYYGEDLTFEQIGKKFKRSKSTVERIIKRATSQLSVGVERKGLVYQDYTRIESKFIELKVCGSHQPEPKEKPGEIKYYFYAQPPLAAKAA